MEPIAGGLFLKVHILEALVVYFDEHIQFIKDVIGWMITLLPGNTSSGIDTCNSKEALIENLFVKEYDQSPLSRIGMDGGV